MSADHVLLLDLDGVVVFESGPPLLEALEILVLHNLLADHLAGLGLPTFVLTHRSRAEARKILDASGVPETALAGVFAAEDLFSAGLRRGRFRALALGGLRKSLILPEVAKRTGLPYSRMALIDDRIDNVEDLMRAGIGMVLHAPSAVGADGRSLTTFDFADAVAALQDWTAGRASGVINLKPAVVGVEVLRRSGYDTTMEARHTFNTVRQIAARSRKLLLGGRGR